MHSFFKPITAEQAQQQVQHFAQQSQQAFEEECALKARAELLRRGPGRPKRERTVDEALSAAAAASSSDSAAAQEQQQQDNSIEEEQQPSKKPKRIHWFDSALIHDILHAYKLSGGSARICAQDLQRNHPALPTETEGRFDRLSESTIRSWFDDEHKLKPQFQQLLQGGDYGGGGHESVLSAHPSAEDKIKALLKQMRNDDNAGINVTIQSVRWVMSAVIKLDRLKLSKAFISRWTNKQMKCSWHRGTTKAAKLLIDWQQKGIDMAKRIAVNMHTHEVRNKQIEYSIT